jgi:hypothetical protein
MVQGFSPVVPLKKLPQMRVAFMSTMIQDAISQETKEKIYWHTHKGISIKVPPSWSEAFFALGIIWVMMEKILMKHDPTLA